MSAPQLDRAIERCRSALHEIESLRSQIVATNEPAALLLDVAFYGKAFELQEIAEGISGLAKTMVVVGLASGHLVGKSDSWFEEVNKRGADGRKAGGSDCGCARCSASRESIIKQAKDISAKAGAK